MPILDTSTVNRCTIRLFSLLVVGLSMVHPSVAQSDHDSPMMRAVQALESVLRTSDDDEQRNFILEFLDPAYVAEAGEDELLAHLDTLHAAVADAGGLDLQRTDAGVHMMYSGSSSATIEVEFSDSIPGLIRSLALIQQESGGGPGPLLDHRLMAVEGLGSVRGEEGLRAFADEHLARNFRASMSDEQLLELLAEIQSIARSAGGVTVEGTPEGIVVGFRGPQNADVLVQLEDQPPHLITSLKLNTNVEVNPVTQIAPIGWSNLEERLEEEEQAGFSGTVLVIRDGEPVLHRGYGLANREAGIPNGTETLFDVGSNPIDFTRAAILKLVDLGMLDLHAPVSRYLENVPSDKSSMTVHHLMSSESGLPNFHHIPGIDNDYDLTYIDRAEALRRILGQGLLFEPGTDAAHSHSAFVLLTAIVEIISGQTYEEFLSEHFFDPAGMHHTANYGSENYEPQAYAVGYGTADVGNPNIPANWGETSWLIKGSGGMISTPGDLHRFTEYIRSGGLSEESKEYFFMDVVISGGSDRGFFCIFADVPDSTAYVCTNSHEEPGDQASSVAEAVVRMAMGLE